MQEKEIDYLKEGKNIALVSDAGTPGICDPGEEIIKKCIELDITKIDLLDDTSQKITATVLPFIVYLYTSSLFCAISLQGSATPGV